MTRYREEEDTKPVSDGGLCSVPDCMEPGTTATPAGPLCSDHAAEHAEAVREGRR